MLGNRDIGSVTKNARIVCDEEDSCRREELREEGFWPTCAILMCPRLARMFNITPRVESVDEYNTTGPLLLKGTAQIHLLQIALSGWWIGQYVDVFHGI